MSKKRGRVEFPLRDFAQDKRGRLEDIQRKRGRDEEDIPSVLDNAKRQHVGSSYAPVLSKRRGREESDVASSPIKKLRAKRTAFTYSQPHAPYQGIVKRGAHYTEVDVDLPKDVPVTSRKSKLNNKTRVKIKLPETAHSNIHSRIRDKEGAPPQHKPPSAWQHIVKEYRKQGFSMKECSEIYRNGKL